MRYTRLPASFFASNRDRLAALLPPGSVAILSSNDPMPTNADGTMGFAQNSDLYYLSGVDQEETLLVLFPSSHDPKRRAMLFLRETSEQIAVWEGAKLSKEEAREVTGIEQVFWLSEMERPLREVLIEAQNVFLGLNEHARNTSEVQTRERRFIEELRRDYPLHDFKRLAPLLYPLRMVKAPEELDAIRQATRATLAGFERLLRFVRPGVQEFEIEAELSHEYLRRRSRMWSFSPIIASGKNATVLHYIENNATCEDGELLLLDCAAEYANYHSDMTRTIPVNGRFSPRQRAVYEAVLRVLRFTKMQLKPGVLLRDVQKAIEKNMEDELISLGLLTEDQRAKEDEEKPALKKFFPHGVSHHIGLDTHDVSLSWLPLAPNMIVTVEPGIYIQDEGLGIRLENLIVIGAQQNEDLMDGVPLEPDAIEAAMNERDSLTGLPTRRAGLAFLDDSVEHNSQVALLFCDIDLFAYFNAEFGHNRGDEELRRIARDLERVCAPSPVFRFSGDEFIIVLPEQSLEGAREVAAQILASQPPVEILATSVGRGTPIATLSFSIGIALFPTHALSAEKLLHAADIALLKAKRGGRLPDGTPFTARNRAIAWGDFLDEFPAESARFLNPDFKS